MRLAALVGTSGGWGTDWAAGGGGAEEGRWEGGGELAGGGWEVGHRLDGGVLPCSCFRSICFLSQFVGPDGIETAVGAVRTGEQQVMCMSVGEVFHL